MQLRGEQFAHHAVIFHLFGAEQFFFLQRKLFFATLDVRFDELAQAGRALLHAVLPVAAVIESVQRRR